MHIEITVSDVDMRAIVEDAYTEDGSPRTLGDSVADRLVAQIVMSDQFKALTDRIRDIRDDEIRQRITPLVTDALNGTFVKVNQYGEPLFGAPQTTMREIIMDEVKRYLTQPVESFDRNRTTALQKMVREAVGSVFTKEIAQTIADEKSKVVKVVGDTAGKIIAESLRAGLGGK